MKHKARRHAERILEAARGALAENGPDGFTTRRVAQRAGISHGMVHYHFTDKRDLILALLVQARRDWIQPLEELVDGPGPAESRMRAVIAWMALPATADVMRVHMSIYVFALSDERIRERYAAEYARWRAPFVTLYRQLAKELRIEHLDAKSVGEAFASAADGLVQQQAIDPSLPTARMLRRLFEATLAQAATRASVSPEVLVGLERGARSVLHVPEQPVEPPGPAIADGPDPIEVEDLGDEFLARSCLEQHPSLGVHTDAPAASDRDHGVRIDHVALVRDRVRTRQDQLLLAIGRRREGRVRDDLGAAEREASGHLREPAVVTDHQADLADTGIENTGGASVPTAYGSNGRHVKTFR